MGEWKKLKEEEAYRGWRRIIRKRFDRVKIPSPIQGNDHMKPH